MPASAIPGFALRIPGYAVPARYPPVGGYARIFCGVCTKRVEFWDGDVEF